MAKNKGKKEIAARKSANGSGHHYDASSITVLEGLAPVRKRPGMYIGTTGPDGLHHLITEIFDNSRDEAMGGFCNDIEIVLLPNNRVRVVDNGRGIPVDTHKATKVSALETIMTTLHAGGKFGGEGYKVSGGLHGVGASVVNALSIYCEVVVHRDGGIYLQEYKQGKRKAAVKKIGKSDLHGTIVTFEPDAEIFKEGIAFDFSKVVNHMRQQAYLVKGLRISVIDARSFGNIDLADVFYFRELEIDAPSETFYFDGGLLSLVKHYNAHFKVVHKNIFYVERKTEGSEGVEIALQYVDDISSRVMPFANNIYNSEGGTHLTGFKTALTRTLNTHARNNNYIKESEENFTGEDVLEGLTAVISVKLREIQFEGQTKAKLGSMEAQSAVAAIFGESFSAFLEENPDDARAMVNKVILALKARKAAKAAKDSVLRKGALEGMTLPGKLADCETKSADEAELFLVEGDSAGGCWSGNTRISLVDGRELSFIDLVKESENGRQNFCYTMRNDGHVGIAPILNPRCTKHNASVIKIILDTGEELICTPDHLFRLVDGSYIQASQLTPSQSISPLYRKISKKGDGTNLNGYEMVFDPKKKGWMFTHILADIYNLENGAYKSYKGDHRHHSDFNKRNNSPTNIKRVTYEEHMALHYAYMKGALHRPDVKLRSIKAKQTLKYREAARQKSLEKRELFSANAKKQWENPEYKKYMTEKFLAFYRENAEYRGRNNALLNEAQQKYWSEEANRQAQSKRIEQFFVDHPEQKKALRTSAVLQWNDERLRAWRKVETRKQWTPEFRERRKAAYNRTYLRKAISLLHEIWKDSGVIDEHTYDRIRKERRDRSLIKVQTIAQRFFEDDRRKLQEAVVNYNHRIKAILPLSERIDVYDLEVPETHNFGLASGIFVHNSSKQGRDRRTQAVLPLKGKILNVERARLDKILGFAEIKALVIALGTGISDSFDISRLRYHKVIIATDADVDGAHIRTLLLTLFFRYFRQLIDGGFIYIAKPPLYKVKRGKEFHYFYSDEEKNAFLKKEGVEVKELEEKGVEDGEEEIEAETAEADTNRSTLNAKRSLRVSIQRYKGLGEMNPEELWETTMDPEKRTLKKVTVEDAQEADKIFDILMGEDVPSRKSFIQSNATKATLDI
ncbi:MAG TPA: intein-containing DNA gyrase subunit B [Candidatus Taylorbacteria bacterium]|nr:MAG: gyrase subunit B protein [Parcubacteria group bacterium GW2011_GWC2_48_17]HBV00878.1 intein-containing DNA gyrase subunit B [Candidatus Taylorbacteria bacterium]